MDTEDKSARLPAIVKSVTDEVQLGYWKPQSIEEWAEIQKTTAFLNAWVQQQDQERTLRKMIGIWVFILITLQVIGVFGLVVFDALKLIIMNVDIVKLLIPSVLAEVFGMGLIVMKYLFKPANINPLKFEK